MSLVIAAAKVTVARYAGSHFDSFDGAGFERGVADQISFLRAHGIAPASTATAASDVESIPRTAIGGR